MTGGGEEGVKTTDNTVNTLAPLVNKFYQRQHQAFSSLSKDRSERHGASLLVVNEAGSKKVAHDRRFRFLSILFIQMKSNPETGLQVKKYLGTYDAAIIGKFPYHWTYLF